MKTKLFLLLTVLSVLSTQAQNLTIKGRVTDTSQEAHHSRQCIAMDHGLHSGDRSDFGHTG